MNKYTATFATYPRPVPANIVLKLLSRVYPALCFLHRHRWCHGDVKPENVFIDHNGDPHLGDYGSAQNYATLCNYTGGTLMYQVDLGLLTIENALRFDTLGLWLTALDGLGFWSSTEHSALGPGASLSIEDLDKITNKFTAAATMLPEGPDLLEWYARCVDPDRYFGVEQVEVVAGVV